MIDKKISGILTLLITLCLGCVAFAISAQQGTEPEFDSLSEVLNRSKEYYAKISNYSCIVRHGISADATVQHDIPVPEIELIFLKPARYHIDLDDTTGEKQEFIFIEGDTHRQFLYPKEYKISGDGSLLYNGHVISMPGSSLSVFYDSIIPLVEEYKDTIACQQITDETDTDTQSVAYSVTFPQLVEIANLEVKRVSFVMQESNAVPLFISFYDANDTLIDSVTFEKLAFDTGITEKYFEDRLVERRREEDMVVESTMVIDESTVNDPEKLQSVVYNLSRIALEKYTSIHDYSARFIRRERVKGEMQKPETFFIKFRKPFDLYMKWIEEPNKGWELIYARGKYNNQVVVHVTGLANLFLPTLELDPAGALAMMNNRHSILEFGLGHVIENYYRDVSTAIQLNELGVTYLGEYEVDGRPCWVIQTTLPKDSKEYYCYQAKLFFDKEYKLPTKMLFYEWNSERKQAQLIEEYVYEDLSFNNRFTDHDFDRKNKEYDF